MQAVQKGCSSQIKRQNRHDDFETNPCFVGTLDLPQWLKDTKIPQKTSRLRAFVAKCLTRSQFGILKSCLTCGWIFTAIHLSGNHSPIKNYGRSTQ
jgi:hypothetical protein